uniref:Uncharacterized protein n=1 Tax=Scophthalmus maximus TaxID=52904 RepID=A0A8D3CUC9_SCOMX
MKRKSVHFTQVLCIYAVTALFFLPVDYQSWSHKKQLWGYCFYGFFLFKPEFCFALKSSFCPAGCFIGGLSALTLSPCNTCIHSSLAV